ncbi:MAG: ABC transporter ATP-binding protein [Faecousia sp.]
MSNRKKIRPYIRQFYRGNGWRFALAALETVVMTASALMISWLIQVIIDMTTGADVGFTFPQVVLLCVLGLAMEAGAYGLSYCSKPKFIAKGIGQYQEYVFSKLCKKGIAAFSGENTSLYISALSNDATAIEGNYLANIFLIADHMIVCIGALALMFFYSPLLTVISIALSALPLLASVSTGNLVAKAEKKVSDRNETYMSTLKDSLVGFSVIKSFRAEAQMCRIFAEQVREVSNAKCLRRKMSLLVGAMGATSGGIVQFGVFLIGAYLALSGAGLSAGSVLIFVQLLNYVINPIATIPQAFAEIKASKSLIGKIADALEDNVRDESGLAKAELNQGITVKDLSFGYEESKPILRGVDFTFEAGKSYAIVGSSGSGKSTLLNLLMASYSGYTGSIRYDGTELRQISSESLYEILSVVQQNVFVFNASIRDNITMFSDFPKEEVDSAIHLSGVSQLIRERGETYLCGENGNGLSGGEKQRISIARSLLKKSRLLLVDEATAALDPQTAFQVSSAILDLKDLTRIVVTHRLDENLLRRYDCVLTLRNGRIAESGTFEDLMRKKGYFYSLYTVSQ